MALNNQLLQFLNKPSGVYTLIEDSSTVANNATLFNQIPLVVGFSKKGVFNTPKFIDTKDTFVNIFGKVDRNLEKQGAFFHRTALELLTEGPVIALNLYNLKDEIPVNLQETALSNTNYDLTDYVSLSTSVNVDNTSTYNSLYTSFFDRKKYWVEDKEKLKNIANADKQLFSFVNLSQNPLTVFVIKDDNTTGFDLTVREWYENSDDIPEFLHEDDKISDFFVKVIVLKGDYTNYSKLSNDRVFSKYFTNDGLIESKLDDFLSDKYSNIINIYSGCLIPEFIDKDGQVYDIETLINSDYNQSGLLCSLNEHLLEGDIQSNKLFDLVGHNIYSLVQDNPKDKLTYLSYDEEIMSYNNFFLDRTVLANNITFSETEIKMVIPNNTNDIQLASLYDGVNRGIVDVNSKMLVQLRDGSLVQEAQRLEIIGAEIIGTNAVLQFDLFWSESGLDPDTTTVDTGVMVDIINNLDKSYVSGNFTNSNGIFKLTLNGGTEVLTPNYKRLYDFTLKGRLYTGDKIMVDLTDGVNTADSVTLDVLSYTTDADKNITLEFSAFDFATNGLTSPLTTLINGNGSSVFKLLTVTNVLIADDLPYFTVEAELISNNIVKVSNLLLNNSGVKLQIGSKVLSEYDGEYSRLTTIESIINNNDGTWNLVGNRDILLQDGDLIVLKQLNHDVLKGHKLTGFTIKKRFTPNNTNTRVNEIYNVLNTNLFNFLTNKRNLQFRYIVDTFNGGIETGSKSVLTNIAKTRGDCIAICNTPSIKEFEDSKDPYFKNSTTNNIEGDLNFKYLKDGGNLEKNPSVRYTLPTINDGSAYGAFFTPNVIVRERNKNISVPPSMYVAKLLIRKHFDYKIWDAVAGDRRGILYGTNVVGLEMNFDDTELSYLEKFGINPIILDDNVGIKINSDLTAKQNPLSSLSSLSGVETLIYVQKRLESILRNYLWETNNSQNRLEIKTLVEGELKQLVIDGALYNASVRMDSSNNTNEIIDNLLGVIDVSIEISKKFKSIVNRIKIFKTGGIEIGIV